MFVSTMLVICAAVILGVTAAVVKVLDSNAERKFMLQSLRNCRRVNPDYRDDLRHPSCRLRKAVNGELAVLRSLRERVGVTVAGMVAMVFPLAVALRLLRVG